MTSEAKETGSGLTAELKELCQAVSEDFAMLASLHNKEPDAELLRLLRDERFPEGLGLRLVEERGAQAVAFMQRALSALPDQMGQADLDELAADYADIYLNHGIQASPLESVWTDDENLVCQDSMFQVREWYQQHGLMSTDWRIIPDDHLVLQLQFLSHLFAAGKTMDDLREIARFMDEHLLRWLTSFAERVAGRCATPYFAGIALLTGAYSEELRELLVSILDEPRPSPEEIEDKMRPRRVEEPVEVKFIPGMGPVV
ncbi:MAG: molecular chaperone TorD family protein [Candidatus Sedimenticola endophacoides]